MPDEILFNKFDINQTNRNHKSIIEKEIDEISDERLLATDLDELSEYFFSKYGIDVPVLGEPSVEQKRTKLNVDRYGGYSRNHGNNVEVDAELFRLEVPFQGDKDLFFHRASTYSSSAPRGTVVNSRLSMDLVTRSPDGEQINKEFERFLSEVEKHLDWLRRDVENFNLSIPNLVSSKVQSRKKRYEQANSVASVLKFKLKSRTQAEPLTLPVKRKKFPKALPSPKDARTPNQPILTDSVYEEILRIIANMTEVMERSPAAFAGMDEEALRFQILVPLNGQFEGEARGEVFNYNGKTDILITEKGRNIFVAECKFWRGEKSLSDTIDQLLGYLTWRDTKAAIILFNRNKNFSEVLKKISGTVEAHTGFVKAIRGQVSETQFRFLFRHVDDPEREITITVLAFDVPS